MTAHLGSDLAGATDITPALLLSSGRQALAEALLRRYQTQRGALWYAPNYGLGLTRFVNAPLPESAIETMVEREALEDERVLDASASAVRADGALTIELTVTDDEGPFTLTLHVSELTVALLQEALT